MAAPVLYDLVNPSDAYTFYAADRSIATYVVTSFGPAYGARPISGDDPENGVPIFLFGGRDEWCRETFGIDAQELIDAVEATRLEEVAQAFESFVCGDRKALDAALAVVPDPEARRAALTAYNEARRSSMNDIGARALAFASKVREAIQARAG